MGDAVVATLGAARPRGLARGRRDRPSPAPGGETLSLTDLAIAVAAARAGHALWGLDSDFKRVSAVLGSLELYEHGDAGG